MEIPLINGNGERSTNSLINYQSGTIHMDNQYFLYQLEYIYLHLCIDLVSLSWIMKGDLSYER